MTGNAGKRLFEAIGQIPDEMVLEAAQDQILMNDADLQPERTDQTDLQPGHAGREIHADQAGRESHAGQADREIHAGHADLQPDHAGRESHAGHAGRESHAGHADRESHADHADRESHTGHADRESRADHAGQEIHTGHAGQEFQPSYAAGTSQPGQPDWKNQPGQDLQPGHTGSVRQKAVSSEKQKRFKKSAEILGGYLKYLPVVACLCIVFGSAGYLVKNYIHVKNSAGFQISGNQDSGADGTADGGRAETDLAVRDEAVSGDSDEKAESAQQNSSGNDKYSSGSGTYSGGADMNGDVPENEQDQDAPENGQDAGAGSQPGMLPVRYDAYEGPVFPLTATGDTQKLKVSRRIRADITTEGDGDDPQPLLQVKDTYKLRNTSGEDKTLQIVYPFVTTLNQACAADGQILQIQGEDPTPVAYSIGESISAYRGAELSESASMEDYEQIFNSQTDYQERAMTKEAEWNSQVVVYTFSDIRLQEDAGIKNGQGVIGVTVNGGKADVLTYGFDHSFTKEDGSTNHCFFIPQEQKKLLLIVTGEQEGEPELGYYSNLDCEEKIEGIQCEMGRQEMAYADALRLCSNDMVKKLQQAYAEGMYDASLPEYMDADAAFGALTIISEEDAFYSTLTQRYQSMELEEIFERLFGETRVVYARATVTIPAKQSVQAVVQTQKRQNAGNDKNYRYDFLSTAQSHLQIKKTAFHLNLAKEWQPSGQNMGLVQGRGSAWKAELMQKSYYFAVTR